MSEITKEDREALAEEYTMFGWPTSAIMAREGKTQHMHVEMRAALRAIAATRLKYAADLTQARADIETYKTEITRQKGDIDSLLLIISDLRGQDRTPPPGNAQTSAATSDAVATGGAVSTADPPISNDDKALVYEVLDIIHPWWRQWDVRSKDELVKRCHRALETIRAHDRALNDLCLRDLSVVTAASIRNGGLVQHWTPKQRAALDRLETGRRCDDNVATCIHGQRRT